MQKVIRDNIKIKYIEEENGNISMFLLFKNFIPVYEQEKIYSNLLKTSDWKDGDIKRLQKWYHDDNKYFANYWKNKDYVRWESHTMESWLEDFRKKLSYTLDDIFEEIELIIPSYEKYGITKAKINSTLINYYRDGSDSIKYHKDDEKLFGDNPTIAICTFGLDRPLIFKRTNYCNMVLNNDEGHLNQTFTIKQGDLFLMLGSVQKYYCHGIEKDDMLSSSRYSLTFREHIEGKL